jgi:hypothetical protein
MIFADILAEKRSVLRQILNLEPDLLGHAATCGAQTGLYKLDDATGTLDWDVLTMVPAVFPRGRRRT